MNKKVVAVFFGGQAVEHDISVLTGLQIIEAIDTTKYTALPIYVDQLGSWWHGEALLDRKNYHFSNSTKQQLQQVELPIGQIINERPFFRIKKATIFSRANKLYFDLALLAFHGEVGEDGLIQGVFATAKIPYTGCRTLAAAVFMNKIIAKKLFSSAAIPVLPDFVVSRPAKQIDIDIEKLTENLPIAFPVCVKPCNLGSSIGVYKADDLAALQAAILAIFKIDQAAIIEPFVPNLVEYNIAVSKALDGSTSFSAIEKPIKDGCLLSFNDKYMAQGGLDSKLSVPASAAGMASASRELNPTDLTAPQREIIYASAKAAFELVGGCGVPRIDFLCNAVTGEIWLNEVNPLPGSLGYYLWEARIPKVSFTRLIDAIIQEGFLEHQQMHKEIDLTAAHCSIFPKHT